MPKPVLRWSVGETTKEGLKCLRMSVKSAIAIYRDRFDYHICHNGIGKARLEYLERFPVQFVQQEKHSSELLIKPRKGNPCWKLYPPRLARDTHEIFIDNDLILYKPLPMIDEFLGKSDMFFISEAIRRSYGSFDRLVKHCYNLNTGLMGLPPGYDFGQEINRSIKERRLAWSNHLEEQGLVSHLLCKKNLGVVTLSQVYVCHEELPYNKGTHGIHFVGLNRGFKKYWKRYINSEVI